MLPGFRFLFAAIILSMSVLIFGLGAAALLRAAHEQFASIPSRRTPSEPVFAQHSEPAIPTLALLRVEPTGAEKAPDQVPAATGSAEPAGDATPPAEPEKLAALNPDDTALSEPVKPEIAPAIETAPANPSGQAEAPDSPAEPKLAALPELPATETASMPVEPATEAPSPEARIAATRIATLGGPAVTIAETAVAKPDARRSTIEKRSKARQRSARRARLARQAAPQQPADPFAQPTATVRSR